jgi:hypothetical protein
LRLVARNLSSKEIAKEVALSPQTVDQYLSRAVSMLGVTNRREAARLFVEHEAADEPFNKSEFKSDALVRLENSPSMATQTATGGSRRLGSLIAWWLPPIGGDRHDLKPANSIFAIMRVSFFTMGTAGAIIAIVFWLNRLML